MTLHGLVGQCKSVSKKFFRLELVRQIANPLTPLLNSSAPKLKLYDFAYTIFIGIMVYFTICVRSGAGPVPEKRLAGQHEEGDLSYGSAVD
jgi:hypothetical protein